MTLPVLQSETRQTIVRLLSILASTKEINQYLKRFSQLDAKRFAVVNINDAILRDGVEAEAVASSLSFLQAVGLTPIVLLGTAPGSREEPPASGVDEESGDGPDREAPAGPAFPYETFQALNRSLVERLRRKGVRATSITGGVFEAGHLGREVRGSLGTVRAVRLAPVEASLHAGSIPVISSLGETAGGQSLGIECDRATNALVRLLQPFKIIFLTGAGGLLDANGRVIDAINLSTEYDHFDRDSCLRSAITFTVEQMKDLLDRLPPESSISITNPANLANELFTHKGSGTLVRRGERVSRATCWDELDLTRLRMLIESSFGRRLVEDYFQRTRLLRAYVSENYRAAVILTEEDGVPYLDKFAVLDEAQGEGLGRAVWKVMRKETPQLFWRSRHKNQINIFYYAQSDGCFKQEKWKVFWCGLDDFSQIEKCVAHCAVRRPTLIESEAGH
ncbi:N-acetyl-gamma-glutamyl-phosphate reductase (plasmid) [Azospirillum sp. B510]|uniref:acetylglutamate kinase n=1 Tax=Azospirillum sp. (strain B510) TaxID=137722 RepID=UPI0001C4CCB9|nr:acetylglutamate kinase [Azospirillum sp. B510]BAI75430.1 N-acetyl-gamma-glutamyl-phosphate reductase [Azospirillum sp. B510]